MIKQIAALALAGFAVLGSASSAGAHHVQQQPYVDSEVQILVRALRSTGHQLFFDADVPDKCRKGLMGAANNSKQLLICVKNHGGDQAELADTIRHETIHLIQYCKGRRFGATSAVLVPERIDDYLRDAKEVLHAPMNRYPERQHATEAEARVLAQVLDEAEVAVALIKECGLAGGS